MNIHQDRIQALRKQLAEHAKKASYLKIETAGERRLRVDKMIMDLEAKYGDHEVVRELKKIRNNREKAV